MSDRERNAIEKAALEDPFLSDALEGYLLTPTPGADLESIKNRLSEKSQNKKKTILFFRHNNFMKVAAILLLMAGAGWLIIQMGSTSEKNIAVQSKPQPLPENSKEEEMASGKIIVEPVITDSVSLSNDVAFSKPRTKEKDLKTTTALTHSIPLKESAKDQAGSVAEVASAPPVMMKANVQNKDTAYSIAATDIYGVEIRGDSIKNLNIVMQEMDQTINEVVLNRRQSRGITNQAKAVEVIEPIGGWEDYNNYALNNLKPPEGNNAKVSEGDVVLSFDINSEGEPVNIKIVESYCTSCEKEARRVLQEGPKWKNKNKQNARIRIRF
jgi:PKD repeat protein